MGDTDFVLQLVTITPSGIMPKIKNTRKSRFQSALIRCGMTQADWAKQNGLGREHLNRVLNGHFVSKGVLEKIDNFVTEVEAKVLAA